MTIWAVHYADYGDDGVTSVFDTEEAAKAELKKLEEADKKKRGLSGYYYFVKSYELNQESK